MLTQPQEAMTLVYGDPRRFTQDSPILPEVWLEFLKAGLGARVDLLLNPYRGRTPGELRAALKKRLGPAPRHKPIVYNESHLVAELRLEELIRAALPLTKWWWEYVLRLREGSPSGKRLERIGPELGPRVERARRDPAQREFSEDFLWLVEMLGRVAQAEWPEKEAEAPPAELGLRLLEGMPVQPQEKSEYLLWSVSLNRTATPAIVRSCGAVKADAARRLFKVSCKGLRWGLVDSGVDAGHPAFRRRDAQGRLVKERDDQGALQSRVTKTYDFTRLRNLLDPDGTAAQVWHEGDNFPREVRRRLKAAQEKVQAVKERLAQGRLIDWEELAPHLEVPHDRSYLAPAEEHGTHVAGILAADWRKEDGTLPGDEREDLTGMCPDIEILDLRVLDGEGKGTEFEVLAALQFVRYMNAHLDQPLVQGVNLSLSLPHEVSSYACGRTPVCEECARLVGNGVVVVAAAGNKGHTGAVGASLGVAEYQDISITDPGNAEEVITVGATHRDMPHTYGVSYFSSRGPTGDGRAKPDLVAPGEKIKSTIPGGRAKTIDGTSMAAPHVSGAAALLMARHTELIGQPARVKEILCRTATDLGRERYFQGAGMVDILRAIQSV